jgi:hypothetical protein
MSRRLLDNRQHFGRQQKTRHAERFSRALQSSAYLDYKPDRAYDPAVRACFSLSIHFEKLGVKNESISGGRFLAKNRIPNG